MPTSTSGRNFGIGGVRSRSLLLQSCVNLKKDKGAIASIFGMVRFRLIASIVGGGGNNNDSGVKTTEKDGYRFSQLGIH